MEFVKKYSNVLKSSDLFRGIAEADLSPLLSCLSVKSVHYKKGRIVLAEGESVERFGVVLSGRVQIVQDDYDGNRSILAEMGAGDLVGESFACAKTETLPVGVRARDECELLFIDCRKLASPCGEGCGFHNRLIQNLLSIVSMKNIALTRKMIITSRRTTREKLRAYLSAEAKKAGSRRFRIPFNRQELADYLSVDRSAMSAELSKLRKACILKYRKNDFELL